eukprot:4069570-Prymnesium_polylepis.1
MHVLRRPIVRGCTSAADGNATNVPEDPCLPDYRTAVGRSASQLVRQLASPSGRFHGSVKPARRPIAVWQTTFAICDGSYIGEYQHVL